MEGNKSGLKTLILILIFLSTNTLCYLNPDHFSPFPVIIEPDATDHSEVIDLAY